MGEADEIRAKVATVLGELTSMQEESLEQEVPGWIIRKPTLDEVNSDLALMGARSKPNDHSPFFFPDDAEVVVVVLEGSVRIDAGKQSLTMVGRHSSVVTAGPERAVTALEPLTRIYLIYIRSAKTAGVSGDGQLAASSQ